MPPLYETSLSDAGWEVVEPIFLSKPSCGRPRSYELRLIVDAILYLVKNGCTWRCLPNDFPPWNAVYYSLCAIESETNSPSIFKVEGCYKA